MKIQKFMQQFNFRNDGKMLVGIEREGFILNCNGKIAPLASKVLEILKDRLRFGYELSACQLEDRIGPCKLQDLKNHIAANDEEIRKAEKKINFSRLYCEVASANMPLDVFPDPTGRYQKIVRNLPKDILLAACRVAAIHIHIGMPDHRTAMKVYNKAINHIEELCKLGDGSNGKRLKIYKIMAPDFKPPRYHDWQDFYDLAIAKNFVADPRKCWHLIRLSVHGTIEFRMFGSTPDLDKIINWSKICHNICLKAMK